MPWQQTDKSEQKILFIKEMLKGGSFSQLCRDFGVSRPTGYLWKGRYEKEGFHGLQERSRRPHETPGRLSEQIEELIVQERDRWGDGARKIAKILKDREGLQLNARTVHRVLKRHDRIGQKVGDRPAPGRFERSRANELWQMDFKGEYSYQQGKCYPLSVLDDHSRFTLGLKALEGTKLEPVKYCLEMIFRENGLPEAMLMDHGTPWWDGQNSRGLTRLSVWLICQGIQLYHSGIRHPQTQGKVERFHGSLQRAVYHRGKPDDLKGWQRLLDEFRDYYNFHRPHESLQMMPPSSRYQPSSRSYQKKPPKWEYPAHQKRRLVNDSGLISWGKQYFVSESLAGQVVGVEEIDGRLLVCFRHMYIREVDLRAKRSYPLLASVSSASEPTCSQ